MFFCSFVLLVEHSLVYEYRKTFVGITIYVLQNDGHNIPSNCHHFVLVTMYVSKIKLDPTHWNGINLAKLLRFDNFDMLFRLMVLDALHCVTGNSFENSSQPNSPKKNDELFHFQLNLLYYDIFHFQLNLL